MKIGDGNTQVPPDADLLERMEAAHSQGISQADQASAADGAGAAGGGAEQLEEPAGELEARLLDTARAGLEGGFESADDIRQKVVDVLVDQRYADRLSDEEHRQVRDTLRASLVNDPQFRREVDNMLVLAAGKLANQST